MTTNYAQTNKYGIRTGVSIPSLNSKDNNDYSKDYESVTGFDFSLFGDFGITENFSVKAELAYVRKGGERNGMQPIPIAQVPDLGPLGPVLEGMGYTELWAEFDNKAVFNYIEIPILAKYEWNLGDTWGVYVNAGPYIDFMINPTQETSGTSLIFVNEEGIPLDAILGQIGQDPWGPVPFDASTDVSEDLATIDFGAMFGVGLTASLNKNSELFLDIRGAYGFIPLQNDTVTYGTVHMGNVSFAIGYAYTLPSKVQATPVKE